MSDVKCERCGGTGQAPAGSSREVDVVAFAGITDQLARRFGGRAIGPDFNRVMLAMAALQQAWLELPPPAPPAEGGVR